MIGPTVSQVFETFTEPEKKALYTIANAAIGEVYCSTSGVKDSARLLQSLSEPKKKVAYFLVGKCLEIAVAYICDQEVPYCKKSCRYPWGECRHTVDRDHAKNGAINPDLVRSYPDRFKHLGSINGVNYYEEIE